SDARLVQPVQVLAPALRGARVALLLLQLLRGDRRAGGPDRVAQLRADGVRPVRGVAIALRQLRLALAGFAFQSECGTFGRDRFAMALQRFAQPLVLLVTQITD